MTRGEWGCEHWEGCWDQAERVFMAAVCCRLPVWDSRRPCDRAKMNVCTMRVGKLQSYLLPSFSLASMPPDAPTAKRTQRSLTTPAIAAQLLSVLRGTRVQSTSINVKYYLPLYPVLLRIYRRGPATLLGEASSVQQAPVICTPRKHLFIFIPHSSPCQAFPEWSTCTL